MDIWIIAGGRSSRFGSNKALAPWKNKTLIETVTGAARSITEQVFIIANDPRPYLDFGLPVIPDLFPGLGPLSGLHSALYHAESRRIFLLACDMPLVQPDFMAWMMTLKTRASVIIPEGLTGMEPLHAIYHTKLLPLVEERLRNKRLSIRSFVREVPYHLVSKKEVARFCPDMTCLKGANTPDELYMLAASCTSKD